MRVAYVDSSWILCIAFGEPEAAHAIRRLEEFDVLLSAPLLEAEVLAALRREGRSGADMPDPGISWVLPDRSLGPELARVLEGGSLSGADLWHVATAVFVASPAAGMTFLTFDIRQREAAARLGFDVRVR